MNVEFFAQCTENALFPKKKGEGGGETGTFPWIRHWQGEWLPVLHLSISR